MLLCGLTVAVARPNPSPVLTTALTGADHPVALRPAGSTGRPVAKARTRAPTIPADTTTSPPLTVAPAGQHRDPTALVTLPAALTPGQMAAVRALRGVEAVEVVDTGTVGLQGAPANTLGVDPGSFRNFTPKVTADSDRLWQYVSTGTLAASFEMSRDRTLALGVEVAVSGPGSALTTERWLGAFMSVGLPGIDLVVTRQMSSQLGLTASSGLVLTAPGVDPFELQSTLKAALPGASVVLMRPGLALGSTVASGGAATVTRAQLSTALTAAVSRVGKPYVWGGTGPNGFDCSGLVGWSFAAAGVSLPRTAAEQALAGVAVPLNSIQPGDLLFWAYDPADPAFIDHVALYLGNGQMIEAPQTGQLVHVIPVQSGHLVGAVRINPGAAARLGSPWHH